MDSDGYAIFTEFHRIYIQGVRRALQERLESAYGDDWFQRGALPALSDAQRDHLNATLEKGPPGDLASLLDAGHFSHIVRWNHAAVFAGTFTELDWALGRFRFLAAMRNEWAHIPADGLPLARVISAIQAMQGILVALRRREALEIGKMMDQKNLSQSEFLLPEWEAINARAEDDDNADSTLTDARISAPLALWQTLQSYLVTEAFIASDTPQDRWGNPMEGQVLVTVRVSNVAPASDDRPKICFQDVNLSVKPERGGSSNNLGSLEPGQTVGAQFTLYANEAAHFEYRAVGRLDTQRFFGIQQKGGLPGEIVRPILNEFSDRFEAIAIKEPLEQVLASITAVNPTMTLSDASQVRQKLEQVSPRIEEKRNALGALFEEFYLNREASLGARVREVILLLEELESRIRAVDEAIGQTNLDAIKLAVNNLEQLQLSVLQVEETIRKMLTA